MRSFILSFAYLLISQISISHAIPEFTSSEDLSSDTGYLSLEWTNPNNAILFLEQSDTLEFANPRLLYEGQETTLFVSGLRNGDHYFRLTQTGSGSSSIASVYVQHQPLGRALLLAFLGAITTLATIGVIFWGARQDD